MGAIGRRMLIAERSRTRVRRQQRRDPRKGVLHPRHHCRRMRLRHRGSLLASSCGGCAELCCCRSQHGFAAVCWLIVWLWWRGRWSLTGSQMRWARFIGRTLVRSWFLLSAGCGEHGWLCLGQKVLDRVAKCMIWHERPGVRGRQHTTPRGRTGRCATAHMGTCQSPRRPRAGIVVLAY